jgi:hypothetical protein
MVSGVGCPIRFQVSGTKDVKDRTHEQGLNSSVMPINAPKT